jgi:hypothetical protein
MIAATHIGSVLTSALIGAFVAGLRDDPGLADGYRFLSVDNSHIIIRTKRIDRVVEAGTPALAPLVREMRRKDCTLDTFARCYSACDQILRKAGLKDPVHWHGGLIKTERRSGRVIGTRRIDGDSESFRKEQVGEIVRRARELQITLDEER